MNVKRLLQISVLKTLRFNFNYFGWRGVIHPYIVIAKKVKLLSNKGKIDVIKNLPVGAIKIGFHDVGIADYKCERTIWQNSGIVEFKGKANIGSGSRISNSGHLVVGDDMTITANSSIVCHKQVTIGASVLISWDVLVMDTDFHSIYDSQGNRINEAKEVIVGDHCWLCCRSLILKGANISSNSVIAAGSIVAGKRIEKANCILGSNGNIIKENITWDI